MPRSISIAPATESHARMLAGRLRPMDRNEIMAAGARPGRAVMASVRHSVYARAALVDGDVAAVWGVGGMLLSGVGRPWLLTAPACEAVSPLRFARIYQAETRAMLGIFAKLENYVDATYTGAVRMLALTGFRLDDPEPYGTRGALFRRFELGAV